MTTVEQEAQAERYRKIRADIRQRADAIRAELATVVAEHDARLDDHDRRLDGHDEQLGALEAKVGAIADIHVRAHQAEGLPVPPALRPQSPLRLVSGDGG